MRNTQTNTAIIEGADAPTGRKGHFADMGRSDPSAPTAGSAPFVSADNRTKHRLPLSCDKDPELDDRLDSRRLLTVGQVSRLLSISKSMVYQLIQAGKLESINLGQRATRVTVQEFDRCVQGLQDKEQQ